MTIEDFIEENGVSAIVKEMDLSDILDEFTTQEILYELDEDDMADYLNSRNYDFSQFIESDEEPIPLEECSEIELFQEFARRYKCSSFITKDDLKERICEFIDDIPSFCIDLRK